MTHQPAPLKRLDADASHAFQIPSKCINDGDDLNFFLTSTAYRDLTLWLLQLNRSMFPTKRRVEGRLQSEKNSLTSPPVYSEAVESVRSLLGDLAELMSKAPPSTGPRRFGNVAFRDWCRLADEQAAELLDRHLESYRPGWARTEQQRQVDVRDELRSYLLGSFGSAQRLDYGTGHELSFTAFLGCLWKLGIFHDGEERAIVVGIIQPYLELVRKLIMTYTLEPAGSHGVWGLDDHSFVAYIFGSAQLSPAIDPEDSNAAVPTEGSFPDAPSPQTVTKKDLVRDYAEVNMYFSAIQFIYDVKKGPFWEHSPVLFDISGIKDGWGKINKGMLKMYAAETLGKFPVVQHFPFGSLFEWEKDPLAVQQAATTHAQHQPQAAPHGKETPSAMPTSTSTSVGTAAPWAQTGVASRGMQQTQAATGVPSMRAPWAGARVTSSGLGGRQQAGVSTTAAPWARPQPPNSTAMPTTAAPWARKPPGTG